MVIQSFSFSHAESGAVLRRKTYQTSHYWEKRQETRSFSHIILLLEPRASSRDTKPGTGGCRVAQVYHGCTREGVVGRHI